MSPRYWNQAVSELALRDAVMNGLIERAQGIRLRRRRDAFTALARAVVGQQISTKAAQSVWNRLLATVEVFEPGAVTQLSEAQLRAAGLSGQKTRYIRDLAQHFVSGALESARWPRMADEDVIAALTEVKGIGRWTAEMFLIFHLQRPDVLPVGDLGLQRAVSLHYNGGKPVSEQRLRVLARPWAPWCSVATWYLWRSLQPIPADY